MLDLEPFCLSHEILLHVMVKNSVWFVVGNGTQNDNSDCQKAGPVVFVEEEMKN